MVSAIITSYKRGSSIVERAIRSIKNQSYKDIEIILVDDNKNESNYSFELKKLSETEGIKYVKVDGNKGACAARNLGIVNSTGEYIAFLDDDDEWLPSKIEKQVKKLSESDRNVGLVYCSGYVHYDEVNSTKDYFNCSIIKEHLNFSDLLLRDYIGSTSMPLIKRECFDSCGHFDINQPARQDYEMWMRIARKYDIIGISEKLFIHHMSMDEQISKNPLKAFIGYENIYIEFKNDFEKNRIAENAILNSIIGTNPRKKIIKILYYRIKRFLFYHFKKY